MIKEDTVIVLEDDKEYYVLDSIINDGNNFIMIGEIDSKKDVITDNIKIMYYDEKNDMVRKVTDEESLFQLANLFADKELAEEGA